MLRPAGGAGGAGGFDIAGLCGVFLGGALEQIPIVMDGFISSVAALCAVRLCPGADKAVFASHVSAEPAARLVLEALHKKPLITADLHLGEGTGAVASLPLWDIACGLSWLLFLCGGRYRAVHTAMLTLVIGGAASGKARLRSHSVCKARCRAPTLPRCRCGTPSARHGSRGIAPCVRKSSLHGGVPRGLEAITLPQRGTVLLEDLGNLAANELYDPAGAGEAAADACCGESKRCRRSVRN